MCGREKESKEASFILAPSPHLRSVVRFAVDDLRRGVQRAAAEGLQHVVVTEVIGQPEVRDLWAGGNTHTNITSGTDVTRAA